jgi:hypothetical protein
VVFLSPSTQIPGLYHKLDHNQILRFGFRKRRQFHV